MNTYTMIKNEEIENLTKEHLVAMYNDAVETIWHLNIRLQELIDENESLWESYDKISNELYG